MIELFAPTHIMNFDETLLIHRPGSVVYNEGKPVQKSFQPDELLCNVQPLDGRQLLLVPEGDRFKEQYYVFTEQKDRIPLVNDIVVRRGANFQVQEVENWGTFSRFRMMRVDIGPYATA